VSGDKKHINCCRCCCIKYGGISGNGGICKKLRKPQVAAILGEKYMDDSGSISSCTTIRSNNSQVVQVQGSPVQVQGSPVQVKSSPVQVQV